MLVGGSDGEGIVMVIVKVREIVMVIVKVIVRVIMTVMARVMVMVGVSVSKTVPWGASPGEEGSRAHRRGKRGTRTACGCDGAGHNFACKATQ